MTKDFFVSEINFDHKDTDGRAHFDMGPQMTTTNCKELLFGYQNYDAKHPCNIWLLPADDEVFAPCISLLITIMDIFQSFHNISWN